MKINGTTQTFLSSLLVLLVLEDIVEPNFDLS